MCVVKQCVQLTGDGVGLPDGLADAAELHRPHRGPTQHGREEEEVAGADDDDFVHSRVDDLGDRVAAPPYVWCGLGLESQMRCVEVMQSQVISGPPGLYADSQVGPINGPVCTPDHSNRMSRV